MHLVASSVSILQKGAPGPLANSAVEDQSAYSRAAQRRARYTRAHLSMMLIEGPNACSLLGDVFLLSLPTTNPAITQPL